MSKDYKHAEIIGPFKEPEFYYAVVGGCKVPYIKLVPLTGQDDGKTEIHLGNRVWVLEDTHLDVTLSLLANAMAEAAGYTNHGERSERFNPFKVRFSSLGGNT